MQHNILKFLINCKLAKEKLNNKTIDFIVIGAAKSGTTTLFELLNKHPDVCLPAQKEVPFFTENKLYDKGVDYFIKRVYGDVSANSILGKITPQYMSGQHDNNPQTVAGRIKHGLPDVKIIAILRDPVERCLSFYKMSLRLGYEKRSYARAIEESLIPENLEHARTHRTWTNTYVVGGEYGRILQYYYRQFDSSRILVLFTSDLSNNPKMVVKKILKFIGANEDYVPDDINKKSNTGTSEPKVKLLTPAYLYKIPLVHYIWQNFVPFTFRRRINQAISHWNIKKGSKKIPVDDKTKARLVEHFKNDSELLEELLATKPPWSR